MKYKVNIEKGWLRFGWSIPITLTIAVFLLSSAWWRIQSVRLGYERERLKNSLNDKREMLSHLDKNISVYRSIATLDQLAKKKFGLQTPEKDQIVYLQDEKILP